MNYSTYRITLDVRSTVANVQLTAKKGDAGRKVYITLSDKGNPCEIADGLYAVFAGVKPDGTLLYNKTTIENNTIIYEMTQQTTAVPGLVACEVKLFDSMSNLLTSPKLTILVDDVVVPDEEIVSQNEITALAELILDATASSNFATEAANAAIAAAGNAQVATESANGATASANQAAEGAITAASNANTAAGNATTEAGKATQATEKANLATTNANNAASDARAATEGTNTARENIVQTTGEILTSLRNAVYAPSIECLATGDVVAVNDASNQLLHGLHIYGKTTQNGTPTPEAPMELVSAGNSGVIKTTVVGKNLLENTAVDGLEYGSVKQTVNADGSITLQGTSTAEHTRVLGKATLPAGDYLLSTRDATYSSVQYWVYVNGQMTSFGADGKFTLTETSEILLRLYMKNGAQVSGYVFYPYIYHASVTDTTYEPYKPAQSLTASTPNGLPGIPVSSGGNYTDADGQQWVCDEIDFGRGVYVQRIFTKVFDGTETFTRSGNRQFGYNIPDCIGTANTIGDAFCSHFVYSTSSFGGSTPVTGFVTHNKYAYFRKTDLAEDTVTAFKAWLVEQYSTGNPMKLLYLLLEPIETALSAEELASFAALHSNKPNTTVFNDAGAGLAVEYVADTKNYIDNKFTELQNAILSAGANI